MAILKMQNNKKSCLEKTWHNQQSAYKLQVFKSEKYLLVFFLNVDWWNGRMARQICFEEKLLFFLVSIIIDFIAMPSCTNNSLYYIAVNNIVAFGNFKRKVGF